MSLFDKITSTIHSKFYFSYSIQRSVWKVLTSLQNEQKVVLHSMRTRRVKKANLGVIFWVSLKANSSFKSFQTLSNISSFWSFLLQTLCTFETSHFECPVLHSWVLSIVIDENCMVKSRRGHKISWLEFFPYNFASSKNLTLMDLFDIDLNKLPQIQPWKNSFNSRVVHVWCVS